MHVAVCSCRLCTPDTSPGVHFMHTQRTQRLGTHTYSHMSYMRMHMCAAHPPRTRYCTSPCAAGTLAPNPKPKNSKFGTRPQAPYDSQLYNGRAGTKDKWVIGFKAQRANTTTTAQCARDCPALPLEPARGGRAPSTPCTPRTHAKCKIISSCACVCGTGTQGTALHSCQCAATRTVCTTCINNQRQGRAATLPVSLCTQFTQLLVQGLGNDWLRHMLYMLCSALDIN